MHLPDLAARHVLAVRATPLEVAHDPARRVGVRRRARAGEQVREGEAAERTPSRQADGTLATLPRLARAISSSAQPPHRWRAFGIGERTVDGYVAATLAKLGFASRAQIAVWAAEQGLGGPEAPTGRPRR
jgi:hypothetical protein